MKRVLAVDLAACFLLLAQYLLGMVVNVFVARPGRPPGATAAHNFPGGAWGGAGGGADGPAWAAAHAAFGLALVVAAIVGVALTWGKGSRAGTALAIVGALAVIGAGFNGASFLDYGHAFSSMIMAGLWALALAAYLTGALLAALAGRRAPGSR